MDGDGQASFGCVRAVSGPLDDDARVVISDLLTWLRAVELQVERYDASWEAMEESYRLPLPKPPVFDEWVDAHFLAVAAWQLCEAVRVACERRPDLGVTPMPADLNERAKVARHRREHWSEYRWPSDGKVGPAGKAYAERFAGRSPEQLIRSWGHDGSHHTLYGILEVDVLLGEVARIRRQLLRHVAELDARAAKAAAENGWDLAPGEPRR